MARAKGELHWLWRLLLIPLFVLYTRLFDVFDFLQHVQKIELMSYACNFLFFGAALAGLVLMLAASPQRRLMLGAGLVLLLAPEILMYGCETRAGEFGLQIAKIHVQPVSACIFAGCALWGLLMIRGPRKREGEKALLAMLLIARSVGLFFWKNAYAYGYIWYDDARLFVCAVCVGAAADAVYCGLCAGNVVTSAICGAWLVFAPLFPQVDIRLILYAEAALCMVYSTVLLCSKPARNRYFGFVLSMLGMISYCVIFMLNGHL